MLQESSVDELGQEGVVPDVSARLELGSRGGQVLRPDGAGEVGVERFEHQVPPAESFEYTGLPDPRARLRSSNICRSAP